LWNAMMNYFYDELFIRILYYDPYHKDLKSRKVINEMPFSELAKISIEAWKIIREFPISEQSKIPLGGDGEEWYKARMFIRQMPISELSKISVRKFSRIRNAGKGTIKELKELCFNSGITLQP